jgi:plastocyanin
MSRSTNARVCLSVAALALGLAGVFAAEASARANNVTITGSTIANYAFDPKTLHVNKGKTVHWGWSSNAPHNVTFKKGSKHSATGADITYKRTFKKAGTFKYFCSIHDFSGKIVVG